MSERRFLRPGSPLRSAIRRRFPRLRAVVLAPRRRLHRRRWRRIHLAVSQADRPVLEDTILPVLRAEAQGRPVLFVGVEWYTAGYPQQFAPQRLVTIDVDPRLARYGAAEHHTLDARDVPTAFEPATFSAVVCNGVLGHGLDSSDDIAGALAGFATVLVPGGTLVVGWNDLDPYRPPPIGPLAAPAGLVPAAGAGLAAARLDVGGPMRHVYEVYRRT